MIRNTLRRWLPVIGALVLLLAPACSSTGETGESADQMTLTSTASTAATTPTTAATATTVAATEASSAIRLATDYLAAVWAFDADRAIGSMAPDAVTLNDVPAEGFRLALRQIAAWQSRNTATGPCAVVESSTAGITVRCPYEYHMLGSDQLGLGPYETASLITVRNGEVVSEEFSADNDNALFSDEMWEPFEAWARATHPADAELLFGEEWWLTEESFQAWERSIAEYVEAHRS